MLAIIQEYLEKEGDSSKIPNFAIGCKKMYVSFINYKIENYQVQQEILKE